MDAEQFSLKWNNFHSNLANGFHVLLQDKDLVDVTLAVDGKLLHAHKIVLSVCSPYFKQMFKIQPEKHPICILRGVTYSDLSNILQFMYQGEVNVRQEDLANFLKTAELLQIKGLTDNEPQFQYEPPPIESSLPIPLPLPIQKEQRPKVERSASPYCSAIITEPPVTDLAPTPPPVIPVIPTQSTIDKKRPASSRSQINSKRTKSEIDDLSPPESVDATPKTEPIDLDSDDYDDTSATLGDGLQHFFDSQKDGLSSSMLNMSSSLQESALSEQGTSSEQARCSINDQGLYECPVPNCSRTFSLEDSFRKHMDNQHGKDRGPFLCDFCARPMKNRNTLFAHMYVIHKRRRDGTPVVEKSNNEKNMTKYQF